MNTRNIFLCSTVFKTVAISRTLPTTRKIPKLVSPQKMLLVNYQPTLGTRRRLLIPYANEKAFGIVGEGIGVFISYPRTQ